MFEDVLLCWYVCNPFSKVFGHGWGNVQGGATTSEYGVNVAINRKEKHQTVAGVGWREGHDVSSYYPGREKPAAGTKEKWIHNKSGIELTSSQWLAVYYPTRATFRWLELYQMH